MITDANLTLSSNQAPTVTAFSTNTIDLGQARDIGAGGEVHVIIVVKQAATAAGAATVNFQLVTSANANLSTPTIISQSDAIPKASLVVGAIIHLPVPKALINPLGQRYFGLQYTIATGPLTAGQFDCFVVNDLSGLPAGTVYSNQGGGAQSQAVLK